MFVDSNGREFLKRQRASRSTWALAPLAQPYANDIGRDYFPMTSGAYIEDSDDEKSSSSSSSLRRRQFSIVPDRAQGVASLAGGQLEVMLHREARISDELGNPETLRDVDAAGRAVVVRGRHLVSLDSFTSGARARRALASAASNEPVVAFSARPPASPGAAAGALLSAPLPDSVELLKLAPRRSQSNGIHGQGVELRLAHSFEQGEDGAAGGGAGVNGGRDGGGQLSSPVDVDLLRSFGAAFAPFEVTELTVSGMARRQAAEATRGEPTGSSLRHGERIFNGPLLFDYEKLDEPGKEVEGSGGKPTSMALIPKPARQAPANIKRNVVRLAPLEIRSLALTRPGGEAKKAKAAKAETLLSLSLSPKTSAVA